MTSLEEVPLPAADRGAAAAWLPALLVLFIGSGCAALIYEVVWFQLLQLSIGSSAVSLGVLLGVYMGGMCLGSLLLPRYVAPSRHPLQVYAFLELGIGLFGVLVLYGVPIIGGIYTEWAGSGTTSLILRAIGTPGKAYEIKSADGVPVTEWSHAANVVAAEDGAINFTAPGITADRGRFYLIIDPENPPAARPATK